MFLKILALFLIFQLIFAANSTNVYKSTDHEVLAANVYEDSALIKIQEQLDLLQTMNLNLLIKIDSLEMTYILNKVRLNHLRLSQQRTDLKKDLEELKTALTTQKESIKSRESEKANLSDICLELNQQFTMQRNESKKDFEELKAAEPIKLKDSRNSNSSENQKADQSENISKVFTTMQTLPTSCAEALMGNGHSGIYEIKLPHSGLEPFDVYCLKDTADMSENHIQETNSTNYNSAWLVIQRRQDGSIDFYRNWTDYQHGFGNLEGEFFIGLDKLHALTQSKLNELWIQLEDFEGLKRWAKYSSFAIGGESDSYALNILGKYTGDAGDSLHYHTTMKWSTFDRNNDLYPMRNCAEEYAAGWWFYSCLHSNLNGQYLRHNVTQGKGINWHDWHGDNYSLKYAHMAIRPVQ